MAAKKKVTQARLIVGRYGKYREGDTVEGDLAATLVERGMARDTTPQKKAPRKTKAKKAAPENKKSFNPEK